MKKKRVSILVFIYNSYKDPLFQNLLLSYIKTLSQNGNYRFDLVTFEQEQFSMSREEIHNAKSLLKQWNIHWHPRQFHTGKFLLLKKLYDVFVTFLTVIRVKFQYQPSYVFAFANVAAAFSILFSKLLRLKLVIYSYEPHSKFMVELGIWSKKSLKYRVLNFLECLAGKYADHIMTGTKHGVTFLNSLKTKAITYRAPTAVDPKKFKFNLDARSRIRAELKIKEQTLYVYFGKLGGLYYQKELVELFDTIYTKNSNSVFLIATNYNLDELDMWFSKTNIPRECYNIRNFIPHGDIPNYLSAADIGVVAIPPSPSQKYRSPTKVAEYLLCGLPYITCIGISEDDDYALDNNTGVVLRDFSPKEVINHYKKIEIILAENKEILRKRCREVGLIYRSKIRIDKLLLSIFK